jgi:23S rRNA (guanosine2251-2'-O)-methyltransferase
VVQTRRSACTPATVAKTSAGALARAACAEVVNIARAIEDLKELGSGAWVWPGRPSQAYDQVDLTGPTALVMGPRARDCGVWCGKVRFPGSIPMPATWGA